MTLFSMLFNIRTELTVADKLPVSARAISAGDGVIAIESVVTIVGSVATATGVDREVSPSIFFSSSSSPRV
jgi:hypothetical protein